MCDLSTTPSPPVTIIEVPKRLFSPSCEYRKNYCYFVHGHEDICEDCSKRYNEWLDGCKVSFDCIHVPKGETQKMERELLEYLNKVFVKRFNNQDPNSPRELLTVGTWLGNLYSSLEGYLEVNEHIEAQVCTPDIWLNHILSHLKFGVVNAHICVLSLPKDCSPTIFDYQELGYKPDLWYPEEVWDDKTKLYARSGWIEQTAMANKLCGDKVPDQYLLWKEFCQENAVYIKEICKFKIV